MKEKTKRTKTNKSICSRNNNKGITLIALILTIIVLLILAVVAINAIKGDGIISYAKNAKTDYTKAQKNEQDVLAGYELMLAQETGNAWKQEKTKVTKGDTTLNVGDIITNFKAGNKTWKVLGAENGKLLLTTENVNDSFSPLSVSWSEAEKRFVDVEKALDEECNSKITLTEAEQKQVSELRSIKVEDINRVTGYDPKTAENGKPYRAGKLNQYGNEVTYSVVKDGSSGTVTGVKYESAIESDTSTSNTRFWLPNTSANITSPYTVRSTAYDYYPYSLTTADTTTGECKGITKDSPAYILLFRDAANTQDVRYWLASSCVCAYRGCANFGLRIVLEGEVTRDDFLWDSNYAQGGSSWRRLGGASRSFSSV